VNLRDRLTVVIPHRVRRDLLLRALTACEGWRVLVVDDTDDGLDLDVPRVRLGGGSGFARAANAGLASIATPSAVVLNDDAAPEPGCLDDLARRGGLCGPVLVGPAGVESTGLRVTRWGRVVQRGDLPVDDRAVDALSGACLHMPASARFDAAYRHGGEDVELCRRLGGAVLVARARCWHEGGGTVPRHSAEAQRHAVAGQLRLAGGGWRTGVVVGLNVAQALREDGVHRPARAWARVRAVASGLRDAGAGR
jgi:GT2 family glycosyltransferase